ncbi:uncharacterized protein FFM5_15308 [Fusarium fujikuroi]|nr:uncharacterized protein FFM5_15308 [Fusarium fujikuroi]
MTIKCSFFISY